MSVSQSASSQYAVSSNDRDMLHSLAMQVADVAARPEQARKRELWRKHNALEPTRPVVFCDPENGWNEILPQQTLACVGDVARHWEFHLRKELFWGDSMGDDRVIEPVFNVGWVASVSDWGMQQAIRSAGEGGAFVWDGPLKSYDDLELLRYPHVTVDAPASEALLALAESVFGDALTVRRHQMWWWTMGLTQTAIFLRGYETYLTDMCAEPEGLHRFMALLRDGAMSLIDELEQKGLLCLNNGGDYVGSGGFGYTDALPQPDFDGHHVRPIDMWGFGESQETSSVGPEQFAEFVFPYQLPLLERFGLNCYGCCEPLDLRWHTVKQIPRLRRVSVSPWCNLEGMAQNLGADYVYSMKPNPAPLAVPRLDQDLIRNSLRQALDITKDCRVEVIMKDNHTIGRNPQNVIDWCRIAREEADRVYG